MENRNFMTLTEDELYEVNGGDDCDKSGLGSSPSTSNSTSSGKKSK